MHNHIPNRRGNQRINHRCSQAVGHLAFRPINRIQNPLLYRLTNRHFNLRVNHFIYHPHNHQISPLLRLQFTHLANHLSDLQDFLHHSPPVNHLLNLAKNRPLDRVMIHPISLLINHRHIQLRNPLTNQPLHPLFNHQHSPLISLPLLLLHNLRINPLIKHRHSLQTNLPPSHLCCQRCFHLVNLLINHHLYPPVYQHINQLYYQP